MPKDADPKTGPAHVAIIMDGNGRWAKARGMPRAVGHERGVEALRRTVEGAQDIGLKNLTVYSFSTENCSKAVFASDLLATVCVWMKSWFH